MERNPIPAVRRLTSFAKGGGCGCKIAPDVLRSILRDSGAGAFAPPALLTGFADSDDAAVWRIDDDLALCATVDFFAPMVDDARDFGRVAAANALSDIYAMGASPFLALALVAAPVDAIAPAVIGEMMAGAHAVCREAGASVGGGHSIDSAEPLFGLCAIGRAHPARIKTNRGARDGDWLLLGKPLGVGVLSALVKRGEHSAADAETLVATASQLNRAGIEIAKIDGARAMTDVTGFGLLGHLREICAASKVGARVFFDSVPLLAAARAAAQRGVATGAAARNWRAIADEVELPSGFARWRRDMLCDPQTGGGLLVSCAPTAAAAVARAFRDCGQQAAVVGRIDSARVGIEVRAQAAPS